MKCPKCGFVSYAGLEQCKKCGFPFRKAAPKGSSSAVTSSIPAGVPLVSRPLPEPPPKPEVSPPPVEPKLPPLPPTPPPEAAPVLVTTPQEEVAADRSAGDRQPQDWREELSERVQTYRKRRGRLQPDADPPGNLELDFEGLDKPEEKYSIDGALGGREDRDSSFDLEIGEPPGALGKDGPSNDIVSLEVPGDEKMQFDAAPPEVEEMSLGEPVAKELPMEIMVGSPTGPASEEEEQAEGIFLAPIGRRFGAGLMDALVLMLGAAIFGIIFWRCCGRLSLVALNIAVLGTVALILIFAYFALFTAIAAATPGLLWMGCEIRNMRGDHPTMRESFWRAFGVLVSLSALMLGFVWAWVDTDGLTWHDRMSGTAITEEHNAAEFAGQRAET